ncbi:MAG: 4Fe-4S binding protein [Halopseudomonas yangmingensis]
MRPSLLLTTLLLICTSLLVSGQATAFELSHFFADADRLEEVTGTPPAQPVFQGDQQVGLIFETNDVAPIPAYSGKPVNMRVGMDMQGLVTGVQVLEHSEPIMLVGIPEHKLTEFVDQYIGRSIHDNVRVGLSSRQREGFEYVDALSGATVTVVVMGEGIMRSAREVALGHGLVSDAGAAPLALVRSDQFEAASWDQLRAIGGISLLHLTRGEIDEAFIGTPAEKVDVSRPEQKSDTFIDLYAAYLNAPTIGRNLLGDYHFEQVMGRLQEGEHAILLMANGRYSFKGSGFVRGGIFDRIQLHQGDRSIQFRDTDLIRAPYIVAEGTPSFSELDIFVVRDEHGFDPGRHWELELLVRRQIGALDSAFVNFGMDYDPPAALFDYPAAPQSAMDASDTSKPLWVSIWEDRVLHIVVLSIGLFVLTLILLFQDWLARRPNLLHTLRTGFLIWTVVFIGWYALAQLSVVNILTFVNALFTDFKWSTFLMDPMMFILWGFVAVSLLLWGRGVYCGWLCPFGAMQELINEAARKLKIRQIELPWAVHERLWALKYLVLLGLFAISLQSMATAEVYAEVEPFKTAISLKFQREWGFVFYAVVLLLISIVNRKFYCRYVCPLGAGLAIPARIRLFDWLKRHNECGKPCRICANECEVQAIHPDGTINANECHYCLDCQVTYWNDQKCPPLVARRKRRQKASRAAPAARDQVVGDIPVKQL